MKFIDEIKINVQAGNGGRGCVSFRREKYEPKGGPDGGDGGDGGSVVLKSISSKRTLFHLRFNQLYKAENGKPGLSKAKTGKCGKDLVIVVPQGTIVKDEQTDEFLADLTSPEQTYIIAHGGKGGRGNKKFQTSTNRAPRHAQTGEKGEVRTVKLELKLIADVGIVGLPNAGKSTLVSIMTSARPKIADYPFTTLTPSLGVVQNNWDNPFVIADIPGLIEGAHKGTGLGIRFLKHIERTKIILHLIDASNLDLSNITNDYHIIENELKAYSQTLAEKKQIIVLNKMDIFDAHERSEKFESNMPGIEILKISAFKKQGIDELINKLSKMIES